MRWWSSTRRALRAARRRALSESALVTAAFVGGLALCAVGVGLIYLPAGLIVGGLELAGAAAAYERNGQK